MAHGDSLRPRSSFADASAGLDISGFVPAPARNVRVLVLDDDEIDARTLTYYLDRVEGFRFTATHVTTPGAALAAIGRESFDLCIADYWLGAESAVGFITELGRRPDAPPVVVLSQLDSGDIQDIGLRAGAAAFLSKDLLTPELIGSTLRSVLHDARRQSALQLRILSEADREDVAAGTVLDWLKGLSARVDRIHAAAAIGRSLANAEAGQTQDYLDEILASTSEVRRDLYEQVARLRDAGRLRPVVSRVDVAGLVADVVRTMQAEADRAGMGLDYVRPALPVHVDCDEDGLRSALRLLFIGAIRHAPRPGPITIRIRMQGGGLQILVRQPARLTFAGGLDWDGGAGPIDLASLVVDRLVSVLMLVEAMVERQPGRLDVLRIEAEEAEFALCLPMRRSGEAGPR